ncbi:MAG: V-type ATP synthase subunit D [Candidatus Bathyarchaeota archaeon]|nr:V-type ATP synthase subunit D [Candidatus Termiticorpusculum sp.]MCL2868404.1 V-type ATP synthase subunit D [Candidatus Termiticorpusculum sp.]
MPIENISPTRISLIQTKKTLKLAEKGREVLEYKRDILLRELRNSLSEAEHKRAVLTEALLVAYQSLREANLAQGSESISNAVLGSSAKINYLVDARSIMGVTVPIVKFQGAGDTKPDYGFANTSSNLDMAFKQFKGVLELIGELARVEGTTFQLANAVNKTQRRVNALKYVLLPKYHDTVKWIELVLEEKEREEFIRTKRIKSMLEARQQTNSFF